MLFSHANEIQRKGYFFWRRVIEDFFYLVPGISARLLQGFALNIILAIYLSPLEMGTYTLFWIGQVYLNSLLSGWLSNSSVRFLPENNGEAFYVLRLVINYGSVVLIFGAIVLFFTKALIPSKYYIYFIAIFAVLLSRSLFFIFQSIMRGLFMLTYFSIFNIISPILMISLLLLFLSKFTDLVFGALLIITLSYLPLCIWQYLILYKAINTKHNEVGVPKKAKIRFKYLKYGIPLSLAFLLLNVLFSADRYILVYFFDLATIGIYAFWMSMGLQIVRGCYNVFLFVLNPRIYELHGKDAMQAKYFVKIITKWYVLLALPLLVLLGYALPHIFLWLKVKESYFIYPELIFPGLISGFLLGLAQLCGKGLEFRQTTSYYLYASGAGVISMVAFLFIFLAICKLGIFAAALASTLGMAVYLIVIIICAWEPPPIKSLAISTSVSLVLFLVMRSF
jgi:O-antigen/teichoic acid export membrane protein